MSLAGGLGTHVIYVAADHADDLIHRYRMRDDRSGQAHLVIVPSGLLPQAPPKGARVVPTPAAAADLLEEDDPRARHAAMRLLGSLWRAATDAAAMESCIPPSSEVIRCRGRARLARSPRPGRHAHLGCGGRRTAPRRDRQDDGHSYRVVPPPQARASVHASGKLTHHAMNS
jgi:hypothetical protein